MNVYNPANQASGSKRARQGGGATERWANNEGDWEGGYEGYGNQGDWPQARAGASASTTKPLDDDMGVSDEATSEKGSELDAEDMSGMLDDIDEAMQQGLEEEQEKGGEAKLAKTTTDVYAVRQEQAGKFSEETLFELITKLYPETDTYITTVTVPSGASTVVGYIITLPIKLGAKLCNLPEMQKEGWIFYDPTDASTAMPAKLAPLLNEPHPGARSQGPDELRLQRGGREDGIREGLHTHHPGPASDAPPRHPARQHGQHGDALQPRRCEQVQHPQSGGARKLCTSK